MTRAGGTGPGPRKWDGEAERTVAGLGPVQTPLCIRLSRSQSRRERLRGQHGTPCAGGSSTQKPRAPTPGRPTQTAQLSLRPTRLPEPAGERLSHQTPGLLEHQTRPPPLTP